MIYTRPLTANRELILQRLPDGRVLRHGVARSAVVMDAIAAIVRFQKESSNAT